MPNKIKPKRSYTTNAVPTAADLEVNEIAINWADGIAYTKDSSGQIVSLTMGGGGGSSVDSRWNLFLPPAPTGLAGTAGDAEVSLSWTAPTGLLAQTPITDYVVQYSANGGATWTDATQAPVVFQPTAVILTSGNSYTVPAGATVMKAWAIGGGSVGNMPGGAGGTALKTWSVAGGDSVSMSIAVAKSKTSTAAGDNTTVTFNGATISGNGGLANGTGGSFSGGDGGAIGGNGVSGAWGSYGQSGGAVGGNGGRQACGRFPATDVDGLFAAVAIAGGTTSETCTSTAAFGSGSASEKYNPAFAAGVGGGGVMEAPGISVAGANAGSGAVVLYFT